MAQIRMNQAGQHRESDASESDIILVSYRFSHHYSVSGYNRLAAYVPCTTLVTPAPVAMISRWLMTPEKSRQLRSETGLTGYFAESRWLERMVRRRMRSASPAVFHFLYPENCYYYTAAAPRSDAAKIIATYHQPVQESRQFILKTAAISKLDAIVLLSESQREFFAPVLDPSKIFVVPHGIDLGFFTPPARVAREKRIVAVGNWLRDFPTLIKTLEILASTDPDIHCDVVTLKENATLFSGLRNISFHCGITPDALKDLYHRAACSVLSLSGAAANNALLESMACGLPLVVTDLPAIREYSTPEGCRYVPAGDATGFAERIRELLPDDTARQRMREANLDHVRRYAWPAIAGRMMEVYAAVSGDKG